MGQARARQGHPSICCRNSRQEPIAAPPSQSCFWRQQLPVMGQLRVAPTQTYTLHLLERPLLSAGIISAFLNFPAALWQNTTCPAETLAWLPPQQQPPTLGVSSLWPSHQTEPSSGGEGQGRAGQRGSAGKGSPAQQGSWQGNSCSSRIAQMCFSKSAVRQGRNRPDQIPPPLCLQSPRLARLTQGGCLHLLRMGGGTTC